MESILQSNLSIPRVPINNIGLERLDAITKTLSVILSTDRARQTYAQIIDGLPTRDVYYEYMCRRADIEKHIEYSTEAGQLWDAFLASFLIKTLEFDARKVQAYQKSILGSEEFNLRLLEMVAVSCHDIAALIARNAKGGLLSRDPNFRTTQFPQFPGLPLYPLPPTDFHHGEYMAWEQYPKGVEDIIGYWAEYKLFGGVVLFDRGESGVDCNAAFIHPVRGRMIFQLSDSQMRQFINLRSLNPSNSPDDVFPFLAEKYARRIDGDESMALNIYRDKWERKPRVTLPGYSRSKCVRYTEDSLEAQDILEQIKVITAKK